MSIFEKRIHMLEKLSKKKSFTRIDFEDMFDVSQPQACVILRDFVKLKFLKRVNSRYFATEKTKAMFGRFD